MSCLSDEPFLLHFNTAADLDENRVPATCHACLKNVSHCSSTPQPTSMKTVCQLLILPVSRSPKKPTSVSGVGRLGLQSWGIASAVIWPWLASSLLRLATFEAHLNVLDLGIPGLGLITSVRR